MAELDGWRVALLGNPNCGKTSLFNRLTGLRQRVGNFAGVTTARGEGWLQTAAQRVSLVDLPGTYGLYARSDDECVVLRELLARPRQLDAVVVVMDINQLARGLQLLTQLRDLGYPVLAALSMLDEAFAAGLRVKVEALPAAFDGLEVFALNPRTGEGVAALRARLLAGPQGRPQTGAQPEARTTTTLPQPEVLLDVQQRFGLATPFEAHLYLQQRTEMSLSAEALVQLHALMETTGYDSVAAQREEMAARKQAIAARLVHVWPSGSAAATRRYRRSDLLDRFLTHPIVGTAVFVLLLLFIFQLVFRFSQPFMDAIDVGFTHAQHAVRGLLGGGLLIDLLVEGILPGLAGVVIFVPQIAFLFFMLALLEDSGYMTRAVALSDKLMRRFGLSGRSIIPLVSGMACAIPAVMASRSIQDRRDRLLTIMVVPLMSCSARLPVYTMLIALLFPADQHWGPFSLQGLTLLGMYLLGVLASLVVAVLLRPFIARRGRGFLVMELPPYRMPMLRSVLLTVYQKSRSFVIEAGRIILAFAILLWVLSSYGGQQAYRQELAQQQRGGHTLSGEARASLRLKHSYMGQIGRQLEPVVAPLGYDWKISIALVASFAAREVFVSTLAIVYSLDASDTESEGLKERLRAEQRPGSTTPFFDAATCVSLLVFYAFAMQCMSTLAIVYRETGHWRWPVLQLLYMSALAYVSAWGVYAWLS